MPERLWYPLLALACMCGALLLHLYVELPRDRPPPAVSWTCDVERNCFDCHPWTEGVKR